MKTFFDATGLSVEEMEEQGTFLIKIQKAINWQIGDLALAAKKKLGSENFSQVFPEDVSPGLIDRCMAVSAAYPTPESRNPFASWTIHMREKNRSDRIKRIQSHVDAGRTSDEARAEISKDNGEKKHRWLMAIDVNFFLHKYWYSGSGVESAVNLASWIERTVERLKAKGLTDVVCCFDDKWNHRKKLTEDWEDKYKDRKKKDDELVQQLTIVRELLEEKNFACVSIDGMEADDVMASYAAQFKGRVTLLTQDKDMRQTLSNTVNMLTDVEWHEDPTSGEMIPDYKWLSAKAHTEKTGIHPSQWVDFQCLWGDNVDGIRGASGIGEKGAADLINEFGTCEAAIAAAKDHDERIKPSKRKSLIEFEGKLQITRQLVSLRTDLPVPSNTMIG